VALGAADLFNGPVRDRKIDLPSGHAALRWGHSKAAEEALDQSVVTLVLQERSASSIGQAALPTVPLDQSELL
jgi:hypothetical protein